MRGWICRTLSAAVLLAWGATATVQAQEVIEKPVGVRIGALLPTDTGVRDATEDVWFSLGLDYTFARTDVGNDIVGAIDFATADDVNIWALQALYKWRDPGDYGDGNPFSFGLGLGVYFLDPDIGDNQTEFGVPVFAEYRISDNAFLQGKWHWVVTDTTANAVSLQVGFRL